MKESPSVMRGVGVIKVMLVSVLQFGKAMEPRGLAVFAQDTTSMQAEVIRCVKKRTRNCPMDV